MTGLKKVFFIVFLAGFSFVYSQEAEVAEDADKLKWGFIFNTSNILLDIESYQAGVGAKVLLNESSALRILIDGYYTSSSKTFSSAVGLAYESHFRKERVSPYWGGYLEAGFTSQKAEIDSDNWTQNITVPISAGPILGVEFFILEFLSLFAEYNLELTGTITSVSTSTAGVVTKSDPDFSYSIDTGIGNEAKLGIIIYLDDIIQIEKDS